MGSFADILPLTRSVLPEALIDERGWQALVSRTGGLPSSAADAMFGFECRLDDREASADLLLSLPRDGPFADALVREGASSGDPAAASLASFLSELRQPNSPFAAAVDSAALEYDVAGVEGFPAPGVFLRSTAGHRDPGLLSAALALAAGWNEEPRERRGVARVLAALPPGAAIRWAGAFPARATRAVRLLIRALGDGTTAFLNRLGWTGDATAVDRIVSEFRACGTDNHVLALDVVKGRISPRLGLELSRPGQAGSGWRETLAMMVREHRCLPEKAAALGLATRGERIYSRSGAFDLHCGLHHIKLAPPPGKAEGMNGPAFGGATTVAKGYIACVLRPLS